MLLQKRSAPEPLSAALKQKRSHLGWYISAGILLAAIVLYAVIYLGSKPILLAYDGKTCVQHLLLAPTMHKYNPDGYTAQGSNTLYIGNTPILSTSLCITPNAAPAPGDTTLAISPFGGWLFKRSFTITAPTLPRLASPDLASKPISTALPLEIALSEKDTLHNYRLKVADKATSCTPTEGQPGISCDISTLNLTSDTSYNFSLERGYADKGFSVIAKSNLKTLSPILLTDSSIKNDQTIYTTLQEATLTFDKPLKKVEATLIQKKSNKNIEIKTVIDAATLSIEPPTTMERKTDYTLVVSQAIGEDGSSLAAPIETNFTLSGGPKVTSISAGSNNIPQSTTIKIVFDQPIHETVDVSKFISIKGVAGSIKKISPDTAIITLQNAPLCAGFTIEVAKGMKSGVNEELGDESWKHDSRIVCGTSSVIGHSVRGRPIVAYYFGSGTTTILFTGAIHGNEGSTYTTMMGWVHHLQVNAHKIPAGKRVVIVPNLNPDGIATGSRNNANNVNLGRNFPTANWKADIETASGALKNGGGTSALSEPEAKALANLTIQLKPRMQISFHSQGRLVGANKFGDSVQVGNIYANTVGYATMYHNAEAVMGYPMTGEYEDWMGESMGLPAILIELPSHSGNYIASQLTALWKIVNL